MWSGSAERWKSPGVTPPGWLDVVGPFVILGVILGYLAFGYTGLRTETVSRTTALIVLTPALVMVYNIASAPKRFRRSFQNRKTTTGEGSTRPASSVR